MSTIDLGILKYTAAIDSRLFKTALDGMDRGIPQFARSAASSLAIKAPAIKFPALTPPKMGSMGGLGAGAAGGLDLAAGAAGRASSGFGALALKAGAVGIGLGAVKLAGDAFSAGFGFLKDGVKAASDLEEQLNATTQILGKGAPAVVAMADEMASRVAAQ